MKRFFFIIALATFSLVLSACHTTLQSGGAYAPGEFVVTTNVDSTTSTNFIAGAKPDAAFYAADEAFNASYAVVDSAFKWERDNREQLFKISPDIKHTLDKIRPAAWDVQRRWSIARKAYEDNPQPYNFQSIQSIVAEIQSLASQTATVEQMITTNSVNH